MNKNIAFYIILVTDALYLILAILGLCVHGVNDWSGFALTVALGLLGVMCGWIVGFLASPTSVAEETALGKYAKTISAFISGYVASKAGPILTEVTSVKYIKQYLLFNPINSLRVIIFSYCFLSGILLMYVSRSYFNATIAPPNKGNTEATSDSKQATFPTKVDAAPIQVNTTLAKQIGNFFTKFKSLFNRPTEPK